MPAIWAAMHVWRAGAGVKYIARGGANGGFCIALFRGNRHRMYLAIGLDTVGQKLYIHNRIICCTLIKHGHLHCLPTAS